MEKAAITGYIVSEALIKLDQPEGTQLLKDITPSIAWMRDLTTARTTHHLSPGGEILHLRAQIQGRLTIYRLEERYYTCGHKSKDDSPSIAWRRDTTPAGTNPRTTHHLSPGGEILHLRAQIQGRLTIYRLGQRGVGRGSARRSFLKVQEVIVKQMVTGTVSKTTLEKCVRDEVVRAYGFFRTHRYILELSKLNWRNKRLRPVIHIKSITEKVNTGKTYAARLSAYGLFQAHRHHPKLK